MIAVVPDQAANVAQLRNVPLFAVLDETALERVAAIAKGVDVPSGQVLTERNQPGSGLFLIVDGTVRVELPGRAVELGAGEVVGELSLLTDDAARTARAMTTTPVRCLAIPRADFAALLADEPRIAVGLLAVVARRLAALLRDGA